ncbi:isochorismate synthase DhbC [Paenibacillus xylaniclasticus]|uniref:isochorismate synthase DhbC n=1 Tax=Paenibacillus xylaniclasticus TaxID=588083 RepID=UPI000FD94171|nr:MULTISPECIES: isochorismate synthase DhbC [Paenibacillus]GFN29835.1 isochorismate synthase DhbC [Paenibacillus curdlanolyticus]
MNHTAIAARAVQLLEEYRPGSSFFLSTPEHTMLAEGVFAELPAVVGADSMKQLTDSAAELLCEAVRSGHRAPVLLGAIPFDYTKPAKLVIPKMLRRSGPLQLSAKAEARNRAQLTYRVEPFPSPETYARGVQSAIDRLRSGELSKVVLARALDLTADSEICVRELLNSLASSNSHGYTFAADLPVGHGSRPSSVQRVLAGASPELLVRKSGSQVISNPLAGSAPRSKDPVEDRRIGEALLVSAKDLHEHAVVIEAVASALSPFCKSIDVPDRPSLIQTNTMWHLSTVVRGELLNSAVSSLELAAALHPTPAVCGTPTELARDAIARIEPFDRDFYTGLVGWNDADGNGEWIVTIRCAEVYDRSLRLYAGAGVVEASTPEAELAETSAKFRTMLHALGLQQE